jgi:hypothetical protein
MPRFATAFACLALLCTSALAADKPAVYIDPQKATAADPDFALQGEYAGPLKDDRFGVQIIAVGNGKFHGVAYRGGLPGEGWDESDKIEGDGERAADGSVTMVGREGDKAVIRDDVLTILNADGVKIAELPKVTRQSPTLGAKPPEGAKVLYDGKTNDFKPGKTEGDLLVQGQTSQTKFQSVTLHVEFLLPFMPAARGQGRGNSGVYLQGRYEVQVLDSFGLTGENNECGAIYTIAKPRVNMCYPPLQWQTYDIDYTAATYENGKKTRDATITVRHNGVLIHENVAIPHATTAAPVKEGPEPGPLYLQDHGNPVRFRNVWLVEKK